MGPVEIHRQSWYVHLFGEPIWSQDDLLTRVSVFAFHMFTLWIPRCFLKYNPLDYDSDSDSEFGERFPSGHMIFSQGLQELPPGLLERLQRPIRISPPANLPSTVSDVDDEKRVAMKEALPDEAYERVEELLKQRDPEAYDFAQDRVRIKDANVSSGWKDVPIQSPNPQSECKELIEKSVTLYAELFREIEDDFHNLGPHELARNNPWHTADLQDKAYQLLQVAAFISSLTLFDVWEMSGANPSLAANQLNQPDHYSNKLIYLLSATYHHIRCGDVYCQSDGRPLGFYPAVSLQLLPPTGWGHEQFESADYRPDATFHVKSRVLFSTFCEELREKFSDESLDECLRDLSKWYPTEFPRTYNNDIYLSRPPEFIPH